jgi:hypothetical protein
MKFLSILLHGLGLFALLQQGCATQSPASPTDTSRAAEARLIPKKPPQPLSEVEFRVTSTSSGRARLIPVEVKETNLEGPYGCPAPEGGKELDGKFKVEIEVDGKIAGSYILDLTFYEGYPWDAKLYKASLPLARQSLEQIVIRQYGACNNSSALFFGYDAIKKETVRYWFADEQDWRVTLSVGSSGEISKGKPDGVFHKWIYDNTSWGSFLERMLFDPPTHRFLPIPIVAAVRMNNVTQPGRPKAYVLYEDGYLTDMGDLEKFVPQLEVYKLLTSEAAKEILKLREEEGMERDFGGDDYDFILSIRGRGGFAGRCDENACPKALLFIRDRLLQFWEESG